MSHVYKESWQQFEERTSLERAHRNWMDAQKKQAEQQRVTPTKQPTLRCCYNCKFCEDVEYESTFTCHHLLIDNCVEPTDVCEHMVFGDYE
jgi:hypothetical protein